MGLFVGVVDFVSCGCVFMLLVVCYVANLCFFVFGCYVCGCLCGVCLVSIVELWLLVYG